MLHPKKKGFLNAKDQSNAKIIQKQFPYRNEAVSGHSIINKYMHPLSYIAKKQKKENPYWQSV